LNFCTYFDSKYISFGFSLLESLYKHYNDKGIYVLCLDQDTLLLTKKFFPKVITITLSEIENAYKDLLSIKVQRPATEYIWTLTPHLIEYLIQHKNVDFITYLDSDQYFFDTPKTIIDEVKFHSISILPHRFRKSLKHLEVYGFYNVSWVSMRNDSNAREALKWWRCKCIENCSVDLDKGIVGDQKYLDSFKSRFKSVHDIENEGCGVAPWNLKISSKIILYHFQSLRIINRFMFTYNHSEYNFKLSSRTFVNIYGPFLRNVILKYSELNEYSNHRMGMKFRFSIDMKSLCTNDFIFFYKSIFLIFNFHKIIRFIGFIKKVIRYR
jgi:hypothetical protein